MLHINTLLLLSLFLLPQALLSETVMKCEAGKCSTDKENMKTGQQKIQIKNTQPTIRQLFNVRTVQVKKITSAKEQINYGYVVAQDRLQIDLAARYSGYVETLFADTLYKKVLKGDLLAKVYSPEVFRAKQDYLHAINYNKTHAAPAMLQSAKTNLILLGVSPKEINLIEKLRKVDEFTTIYAPVSGWIFEKNINQGSSFNTNKKLFQIINLENVWVEAKLFQNQLETLHTLNRFTVTTKGVKSVFKASKELLYPVLDTKEATITLRLSLSNPQEILKPGMYVKIASATEEKSRLVIPTTAAIRKNGIWYAFLATEFTGEYEPVKIEVKPLDQHHYEVIQGLHENDSLVNNALFMLDSDAQINSVY